VNDPAPRAAREAAAVTQTALALSGHGMHGFTYELITKMGRGELTGDQAVEAILNRFVRSWRPAEPYAASDYQYVDSYPHRSW
jgi:hypothetical protein